MTARTLPALIVGATVLCGALAALVVAKGGLIEDDGEATSLLLSGRADVPRGQVQDGVFVLRGSVIVEGTVEHDVVVVDGRARIEGVVLGDVVVLSGDAVLGPRAEVGGDLRTSSPARVAPNASVDGEVTDASLFGALGLVPRSVSFGLWLAAGICVLACGLLAGRALGAVAHRGLQRPGRSLLLGAALLVIAPIAGAVLVLSLVGAVLAVVLGAGLIVAAAAGTAATAEAVGRLVVPRTGRSAFLAGWLALGAALALALVVSPVVAVVAAGVIVAHGLGSLLPAGQPRTEAADEDDHEPTPEPEPEPIVTEEAPDPDAPRILAAFPIGAGPVTN